MIRRKLMPSIIVNTIKDASKKALLLAVFHSLGKIHPGKFFRRAAHWPK
jgi:hypothetical protein